MEKERFREALISHIKASGLSIAEIARRTDIPKTQLDKLMQKRVTTTNVIDATVLANYFGKTVEEFMGVSPRAIGATSPQEQIHELLSKLSPAELDLILAQLEGIIARKEASK